MTDMTERHVDMAQVEGIITDIMSRHFAQQLERGRESGAVRDMARDVATMTLARLGIPGDYELHEAVFALTRRMVSERTGASEGEIGDMGIPLRG